MGVRQDGGGDRMTNEEAQIVIENIPIKSELLDDCYDITEYQEAKAMAIKALAQESITWIVGTENCQVAVRNMPIDKIQKICAIIGEKEQQPNRCDSCIHSEEQDGSNCYECVKGMADNFEAYPYEDMRDATEEERKSTKDYIDSISKPTGLRFDDLYEEIDFVQPHKKIPCTITIGKPSEDCISREALLNSIEEPRNWTDSEAEIQEQKDYENFVALVKSMPSVTPHRFGKWAKTDGEINGFGDWGTVYKCSCCDKTTLYLEKFCPNCGAKMEWR